MQPNKLELTAADFQVGQKALLGKREFVIGGIFDAMVYDGSHWYSIKEIKPILRRLDSMSDDEIRRYQDLCWEETFELSSSTFHETIESTLWLIDNGFDVWGWIDAGLAVDAATVERSGK